MDPERPRWYVGPGPGSTCESKKERGGGQEGNGGEGGVIMQAVIITPRSSINRERCQVPERTSPGTPPAIDATMHELQPRPSKKILTTTAPKSTKKSPGDGSARVKAIIRKRTRAQNTLASFEAAGFTTVQTRVAWPNPG